MLKNLTNAKACEQLADSICDTKADCYKKVYGMAFVDPAWCVAITILDLLVRIVRHRHTFKHTGSPFSASHV